MEGSLALQLLFNLRYWPFLDAISFGYEIDCGRGSIKIKIKSNLDFPLMLLIRKMTSWRIYLVREEHLISWTHHARNNVVCKNYCTSFDQHLYLIKLIDNATIVWSAWAMQKCHFLPNNKLATKTILCMNE